MSSKLNILIILLVPFFIGCSSKIAIGELSIEGEIYDEETNEELGEVRIEIDGYGWNCNEIFEDGDYYFDDSCIPLKDHLEEELNENNKPIILINSIRYDRKGYEPQELNSLKWDLNYEKTYIPPEIYLVEVIDTPPCPSNKYPCTDHPSGCCVDCPVHTYWKMENGVEICKEIQNKFSTNPVIVRDNYIKIRIVSNQIDEIDFSIEGRSLEILENLEFLVWSREKKELKIRKNERPSLDIHYTIENNNYTQSLKWEPEAVVNRNNLELRLTGVNRKFIANWETR